MPGRLPHSSRRTPVFLTYKLYEVYGDLEPAREFYNDLRNFVRYFEENADEGVWPKEHQISDHAFPLDVERVPQDKPLIAALGFFEAQRQFARLAEALGHEDDAAHARRHAEKIRAAIIERKYDRENHAFGNGTHDSLALAYGVITDPEDQRALAASLAGHYRKNGHKFDGGFLTYELYPMLSRHGFVDDAVRMLTNTDYPGPAWSVEEHDATSYWERYFASERSQLNRGLNFIAFAHPTGWMITDLAGIRFDPASPGQQRLILAPKVPSTNPD